ncbi:unnamed protein product [Hymenolepis diminuta]|uniref:Uncharacterized protein n=1 Tax=Hymenolepis diminuta TaxID=6216 RepID=A0A564YB62_HYMDI|nr:unnamed protein product [Hymenolepis diminuta]
MIHANIYGKAIFTIIFLVVSLETIAPSSGKILPTGYADFLSPSALEVISSYDDDQLDEFANLSKAELLKLIKMLARHIVAKRSLDYLYGGVRYRKRSPM